MKRGDAKLSRKWIIITAITVVLLVVTAFFVAWKLQAESDQSDSLNQRTPEEMLTEIKASDDAVEPNTTIPSADVLNETDRRNAEREAQ